MSLLPFLILILIPSNVHSLIDCYHGFVGRMQASVEADHLHINDTAMCSAMYCIKVIVHSALDDQNIFQQGISSRCAYTGGDRQLCNETKGKCKNIDFYEGMRGNFSFCCCKDNKCNVATNDELESIYNSSSRSSRRANGMESNRIITCIIAIFIYVLV